MNDGTDKADAGGEPLRRFLVVSCVEPEVLDAAEESFDEVAMLLGGFAAAIRLPPTGTQRETTLTGGAATCWLSAMAAWALAAAMDLVGTPPGSALAEVTLRTWSADTRL